MFKRKTFIFLVSLFLFTNFCEAQKYLVLDSYRLLGFKRVRYAEGDLISFRLNDFKTKYSGEILAINDSVIHLKGMDVPIKTISVVYREKGNFLTKSFSKVFMWSGLGFIILDTGNNLLSKRSTVVEDRALVAGGSLIGLGLTMKLLSIKKYKIGNKHTLKVIDVTF